MRAALSALGIGPAPGSRLVLVAGTNGKGSVAKRLESALRAMGRSTFLFTSPHLVHLRERFRLDGVWSDDDELDDVHAWCLERLPNGRCGEGELTPFEWLTAVAVALARRRGAERWIFEVGLGGRLDATNALEPDLSIVTGIDLDHTDLLGPDEASVAGEKAGVLRPGRPAVLGASAAGWIEHEGAWREGAEVRLEPASEEGLLRYVSPRLGGALELQAAVDEEIRSSVLLASAAFDRLERPGAGELGRGLLAAAAASWPGRLHIVREHPPLVLDGAHNPAGCAFLAAVLRRRFPGARFRLIFGAKRSKDVAAMLDALREVVVDVRMVRDRGGWLSEPDELASVARSVGIASVETQSTPLEAILGAAHEPTLVAGSLFLVGDAIDALGLSAELEALA